MSNQIAISRNGSSIGFPFFGGRVISKSSHSGNFELEGPTSIFADIGNYYQYPFQKVTAVPKSSHVSNNFSFEDSVSAAKFQKAKKRIERLCQNSDDADAPNQIAEDLAIRVLELCKETDFFPSIINASGDESLLFEFFTNENYYLIEIYNSGELIYLPRLNGESMPASEITLEELKGLIKTI